MSTQLNKTYDNKIVVFRLFKMEKQLVVCVCGRGFYGLGQGWVGCLGFRMCESMFMCL